jgi:C-8 sterol isomerase
MIARECIGGSIESTFEMLHAALLQRYPQHVNPNPPWMFNNAGGAMGAMCLLHASITEYLIVFGSPIGTEGHTGRFYADDWFCILDGEQWAYGSGELERQVWRAGDMNHMPRGTARGYRIPDHCWALEYARGIIPAMLPFGVADVLSSTLDLRTLGATMGTAAKLVVRELLRGKI